MKPIVKLARWSCIEGRQRADDALFAGFNYQSGARHEKHRCRDNWQAQAFLEDERYWHGLAICWVRARLGIERRCFVQSIVPRTRLNRRSFQTYQLSIGLLKRKAAAVAQTFSSNRWSARPRCERELICATPYQNRKSPKRRNFQKSETDRATPVHERQAEGPLPIDYALS